MSEKFDQLIQDGLHFYNLYDWEKARKAFEAALALDPNERELYAFLGSIDIRLAKYDDALQSFEKACEPDSVDPHKYLEWVAVLNDWGRMYLISKQYDKAIEKFKSALVIDPKYTYSFYNWGLALERDEQNPNRFEEAAKQYAAAIETDETYTDAWNDWGRMLLELNRDHEAIEKFEQAIAIDPKYKYAYYNWGRILERQTENPNRYEDAAEKYQATVEADPTYIYGWNKWGYMLLNLGKYEEAIEKFQQAIAIDPKYKYAYYNWGRALEDQRENPNRFSEAAKKFQAVVELDGSDIDAWNDWGRMLIHLEKYDEAIEKFKKIIELEPTYKYAYYNWGLALEKKKLYEEAEKQYRRSLEVDAEYHDAIKQIGKILIQLRKQKAFDELLNTLSDDVKHKDIYYEFGSSLLNAEQYEEALAQFKRAEELDPDYADARVGCALAHINLRQYPEAVEKLTKTIELDPNNAFCYYLLGWIFANGVQRDYRRAIEQYEHALSINTNDLDTQNAYGYVCIELNRYDEAIRKFKSIVQMKKELPDGYHSLAYLNERLGNYKESQKNWYEALNRYEKIKPSERRSFDWSFIAQISSYVFHNYKKALDALRQGLEKFPDSIELLKSAVDINLEAKEVTAYESPRNFEAIGALHWDAQTAYRRLKIIFEEKLKTAESAILYLDLGTICNAMDDLEDAKNYLEKAIELDPDLSNAYNTLGAIKTKQEENKESIQYFRSALNKQIYDFGYASNLAEAYRKAELFDQAEKEYQRILSIAPSHMDSLIGLGETYAAIGDAAKEGAHAADAEMMYLQAIQYYSKAIVYEENAKNKKYGEFTEASKRLKMKELNAMYYSRGYARVSLYDVQSRKSNLLLWQALNDFRKIAKYSADENYHKAKRAIKKVLEKLDPVSTQNVEQKTGPLFIFFLAFLLFAMSLVALIKGKPEVSSPGFTLTEQTLQVLEASRLPDPALKSLQDLVGKEFLTQEGLLAAVKLAIGEEKFAAYEKVLLSQPLGEPKELVWKPVEIGYLTLIAFGSLIFMVAGLYLQQISKLKFGSIEIEKSSVSQISSSGTLGIKR